jgi:RNA polymerase sigma factor (TIGR02999 family)
VLDVLFKKVGPELERLAGYYLRSERSNHTLDVPALVNETYMRLVVQRRVSWTNRRHFIGVAGQTMRRILCDYARHRNAAKRGGAGRGRPVNVGELDVELIRQESRDLDERLRIEAALERLSDRDSVAAELFSLRHQDGYNLAEASKILGIPTRTLSRRYRFAVAWLSKELKNSE